MSQITTQSLISVEEEVNLIKQFRTGEAAADKLTAVYEGFVKAVAKEYLNRGLDLSELIAAGTKGLLKAAEKFDETRGFRFISYAIWWVRQSILQALAHMNKPVK
jgi:RNA polymerase primary sigma factor